MNINKNLKQLRSPQEFKNFSTFNALRHVVNSHFINRRSKKNVGCRPLIDSHYSIVL